jgi:hypothetical protein
MTDKMVARAVGTGPASWSLGGLFETLVGRGDRRPARRVARDAARGHRAPDARAHA